MNTETCKYKNQIPDYCEALLDKTAEEEMLCHIAECEQCRNEEAEYRRFSEMIEGAGETVPEELHERIITAVKMEKRRNAFARAIKKLALPACAALLILVATPTVIKYWQASNAPSGAYTGARYDGAEVPAEQNEGEADTKPSVEPNADGGEADITQTALSYVYELVSKDGVACAVQCPVVWVERNVLDTLSMSFEESVVLADSEGVLFKTSEAIRLALASNNADFYGECEYVKVNAK